MIITSSKNSEVPPLGPYGEDEFFAFVESADELDESAHQVGDSQPDWFAALIQTRKKRGLSMPRQIMWLDCVHANYFSALPWRAEACDTNNMEHAILRRKRIANLDSSKFFVLPLLIDHHADSERTDFLQLAEVSWHRVTLGTQAGLPVIVAPDFDLDPAARIELNYRYEQMCDEAERASLSAVFNLNFLPDANLDDLERPDPQLPPTLPMGPGGATIIELDPAKAEDDTLQLQNYLKT